MTTNNLKNIVICGGTSGIGLESAARFAKNGHSVWCIGRTDEHIHSAKERLSQYSKVVVEKADLTNEAEVDSFFKKFEAQENKLDFLVNSSGTISSGGIGSESLLDWDRVINGNLRAVFIAVSRALHLLENSGEASIVNVSSVCSLRPCTSLSYSVSKAGIDMMTKCLARDLAPKNIRVNSVNPGVVESNLQKSAGLFSDDDSYKVWLNNMKDMHPLGRAGRPADVADAIEFLCSEKASWITGATLSVDGGRAVA